MLQEDGSVPYWKGAIITYILTLLAELVFYNIVYVENVLHSLVFEVGDLKKKLSIILQV